MRTSPIVRAGMRPCRAAAAAVALTLLVGFAPATAAAERRRVEVVALKGAIAADGAPGEDGTTGHPRWAWPTSTHQVVAAFVAPVDRYGPGHRGIDVSAVPGSVVRAPAGGVVAFAGMVAGRPLVTIDHGGGLVSTLEPALSTAVAGEPVEAGDAVGTVATGGHAPAGTVHFGVRRDGEYINPLLLLGGIRHAVLLPCCE